VNHTRDNSEEHAGYAQVVALDNKESIALSTGIKETSTSIPIILLQKLRNEIQTRILRVALRSAKDEKLGHRNM